MIKEMIEEEAYLRDKAENISDEIMKKLKPIFYRLLNEYLHHPYCGDSNYQTFKKELGRGKEFEFNRWSCLDGYSIDGDDLVLNYYSAEFRIPLSIIEDELSPLGKGDETLVWYKQVLDEAKQKVEEGKKNRKKEQGKGKRKQRVSKLS